MLGPPVKTIDTVLKNEYAKRAYARLGLRKPFTVQAKTSHYRMPDLEAAGGYQVLEPYAGPEIPAGEWTDLEYVTYPTDPTTFFAPLTSATGENVLRGFWDFGKPDLDGIWTSNVDKAPTLRRYVESIGGRYGRVQLIRQEPNSLRETRWGLHLDDNNRLNPESNGWVVRLWLELTDDPHSSLVLRRHEFDKEGEVRVPLPRGTQVLVDSEALFHGGYHGGSRTRYALITSLESTPQLQEWVRAHSA
jgi:hypothetical protein